MTQLELVVQALTLAAFDAQQAQKRMSPIPRGIGSRSEPPREAAVLALLHPHERGALHILLTRRRETLRAHSGQISFPGGRREAQDADFQATALRETREELGIETSGVRLLGALTPTYIPPSHYNVYPFVGYAEALPPLRPNADEVAEVLHLSLDSLLDPRTQRRELRLIQGVPVSVPYYAVEDGSQEHKVWGATAVMLSELEARLRAVLG